MFNVLLVRLIDKIPTIQPDKTESMLAASWRLYRNC